MAKESKGKKVAPAAKPKAAMQNYDGTFYIFIESSNSPKKLIPLSQSVKENLYPNIDSLEIAKAAKKLDISEEKILKVKNLNSRNTFRAKHHLNSNGAEKNAVSINGFCNSLEHVADPKAGFALFTVILNAKVINHWSAEFGLETPEIRLTDVDDFPDYLMQLLKVCNGNELIEEGDYTLTRPYYLKGCFDFLSATAFSTSIHKYIGGKLFLKYTKNPSWLYEKLDGENSIKPKQKECDFWIPLNNCAVCIAPTLPPAVKQEILTSSEFLVPIYLENDKSKSTSYKISFNGNSLSHTDNSAEYDLETVRSAFTVFFAELLSKKNSDQEFFENIKNFLPEETIKDSVTIPTAENKMFASGLCIYEKFLEFACKNNWLCEDKARSFLKLASDSIFPKKSITDTSGDWDNLSSFWMFLGEFLNKHRHSILTDKTDNHKASVLIHKLSNANNEKVPHLIIPRDTIASAYMNFCADHNLDTSRDITDFTKLILKFNIGARKESSYIGWRFAFYSKKEKVDCFCIPITNLPSEIQNFLTQVINEGKKNHDQTSN